MLKKRKHLKLIGIILSLCFMFYVLPFNPLTTKTKAETIDPIDRSEKEVKKTPSYEEKKITLKIQKNVPLAKEREKIDFEILIDASVSMKGNGSIPKVKEVLNNFIKSRNPNYDRISITTFRGPGYFSSNDSRNYPMYIKTIHGMNNNFESAINTVNSLNEATDESNKDFGGFTPLLDGLNKSKSNLDNSGSPENRKVLIILGDGHPNVGPKRDHYYDETPGDYYGNYANNYPGYELQKELNTLNDKLNNDKISWEEYERLSKPLLDALSSQKALYPGATRKNFSDKYVSQTYKNLNGTIYDNSKADFYDLKYLIMNKVKEIKNSGYEVFSVFLDNEKPTSEGYKTFLANTKENEKLFKNIAKDDNHYFYSDNISTLPQAFNNLNKVINSFDYFVDDTIENGFELMPNTFEASQPGVIPKINGNKITWDITGASYKELEVSYHIKREIEFGNLKVRHIDESTEKDIIDPILSTGPLNEKYTTERKSLPGYEYLKVDGNETDKYISGTNVVTYYYRKVSSFDDKIVLDKSNGNIEKTDKQLIESSTQENRLNVTTESETKNIPKILPQTGSSLPYAPYSLGLLSLAIGFYIVKRK